MSNSPFFNVFLFTLFWALQIFVSKIGFNQGAQIVPFAIQTTVVALILLFFYTLRKLKSIKKIPRKVLWGILLANAIHFGFGGFFSVVGIFYTTAINAGFLGQFATVTTAVLAWVFLKEKVTPTRVAMVVLIMLGTFLLITKGRLDAPQIGDVMIILACLCWSIGNIIVRKVLKETKVDPDIVTFLRPVAGLPVTLLFILFSPLYPVVLKSTFQANIFEINAGTFVILGGLFNALLLIFLNRTLKLATASYMTLMAALTPIIVVVLSVLFLNETLNLLQIIGGLLILSSSYITHITKVSKS